MALPQAPKRQDTRVLVTPLVGDVLFFQIEDCSRKTFPEYGTPHPDTNRWPNHKLVYIKAVTDASVDRDGIYEFYYAANRENQDLYNFTSGWEQIGGVLVPSVKRIYVTPRADFSATAPAIGAAMPNIPTNKFASGYILHKKEQIKAENELDSLFVIEERTYVKPVTVSGVEYGEIVTAVNSTSAVVPDGTSPDTGIAVLQSTVTPLGNGQSVKNTRSVQGGVWPNPVEHVKGKTREDLTPPKFRNFVLNETKSVKISQMPATIELTGDEVSRIVTKETPNRFDEKVGTETITVSTSDLIGQQYGDIVTMDTSERLVTEGTPADTGIHIVSSVVTPLGNGKSVKETKTVAGGAWPDPVQKEFSKEPNPPPAKYRDYVSRSTRTRKTGAIPDEINLTGNQVGKSYKRETPDRVEETVIEETIDMNLGGVEEQVQRRPFVEITTTVTPSSTSSLPPTGNGSSTLAYRSGQMTIYENAVEVATPRIRNAGVEKDVRPFVSLNINKRYDINNNVSTPTGSSSIVFDDGAIQVYEVSEITAQARTGLKGVETNAQSWGSIVETINYTTNSTPPVGGSTRIVYDDGSVVVYESSTPSVTVSGATIDKDPQSWGSIVWNGTYSTASGGERSRQVWSNGTTSVYLNENATVSVGGGTKEIDAQSWGSVIWNGTYSTASSGERSRQVWSNGTTSVYLNEDSTFSINGSTFIGAKEENRLLVETQNISYSTAPTGSGDNYRSRLIYSLGTNKVYENVQTTITPKAVKTYGSVIQYSVPSVLLGITATVYPRKDGQLEVFYHPEIKEGFSGSFPCEVTEYFTEDPSPPPVNELNALRPKPISFNTPYGSFRCGPTLHGQITIQVTTGTEDPVYEYIAETITIPATTTTDYAGLTILAAYTTQPYKNGFIVREYRITFPTE